MGRGWHNLVLLPYCHIALLSVANSVMLRPGMRAGTQRTTVRPDTSVSPVFSALTADRVERIRHQASRLTARPLIVATAAFVLLLPATI
jgi:hypothetical protein